MAKEKLENGMDVDKVTGEVTEAEEIVDVNSISEEYDPFAWRRERDELQDSKSEGEKKVYYTPHNIMRYTDGSVTKEGRVIYNYATGYFTILNGKKISQTIDLEPSVRRADTYDLLDAIFGESDKKQLEVVRTTITQTSNGRTKTTHTYGFRVSAKNEENIEFACTLVPTRGNSDKKDNFINKLKADGHVE